MVSILNNKLMEEKMKKGIKIIKRIAVLLLMVAVLSATLLNVNIGKAASGVAINTTNFPDNMFIIYLRIYVDKDSDSWISEQELAQIKKMNFNSWEITNYKGIEYFVYLEELYIGADTDCGFTNLDISKNVNLKVLEISNNDTLETFDVSKFSKLETLKINYCPKFKKLDVSKNKELVKLECRFCSISELNVRNNTKLSSLYCGNNLIKELDVTNNPKLTEMSCSYNQLTKLDVSRNPELITLLCPNNQLTKLELKYNSKLETLFCNSNQLTELDITNNPKIAVLVAEDNDIKILNLGNNTSLGSGNLWYDDGVTIIENSVKSITLNKTSATINTGKTLQLTATVAPSSADMKTVLWSSSNSNVAKVDSKGLVTAVGSGTATITATAEDRSGVKATCTITVPSPTTTNPTTPTNPTNPSTPSTPQLTSPSDINVYYRTHIQTYGWEGDAGDVSTWRANGNMSGTSGKSKRLEGINIVVRPKTAGEYVDLGVQYTTHCQSYGWLPWSANGEMNGTEGESKRLEAIKLQLTGADKDKYDIYYRVHAQSYGWLGWAKNGAPAGTAGYAKRLEGIQIVVVKKGEGFNQKMENITSGRTDAFTNSEPPCYK